MFLPGIFLQWVNYLDVFPFIKNSRCFVNGLVSKIADLTDLVYVIQLRKARWWHYGHNESYVCGVNEESIYVQTTKIWRCIGACISPIPMPGLLPCPPSMMEWTKEVRKQDKSITEALCRARLQRMWYTNWINAKGIMAISLQLSMLCDTLLA